MCVKTHLEMESAGTHNFAVSNEKSGLYNFVVLKFESISQQFDGKVQRMKENKKGHDEISSDLHEILCSVFV